MQIAFVKSKYLLILGFVVFFLVVSPKLYEISEALGEPTAMGFFGYVNTHHIGLLIIVAPFIVWGLLKDWRMLLLVTLIVAFFLKVKTSLF